MAILKDLIVHGSSRFLNKIYASEIQTSLIEAEAGIFKKLKADDVTVVGLLDVKGQLHTNSWTNSNIATIDGSFYITPTIGSDSGTVAITATSLNFSGANYAVTSLYLGDNSSITWPQYSKVLVTGQILSNGEWIPLGTLLGQLSATAAAASIKINNIKDNKNQTSSVLATLVDNGTTSSNYRNLKVSLYQRASSSTAFYPLGIYITATGDNGRTFLDIYGGVNSLDAGNNYGGFAEPNVRIGNLQGLPNVGGQSPNGWGIYTDNGYFKGIIAADRGYIGTGSKYWVIGNYEDGSNPSNDRSYIYNGTNSTTSTTVGVYLGTDGIRNYKDSTHYVTIKNGVISALGVDLSGKITASSGSIAGWRIESTYLASNDSTGPAANVLFLSPKGTSSSYTIAGQAKSGWMITAGTSFGINKDGGVYATLGKIGGFDIGATYIKNGKTSYNETTNEGIYLGIDGIGLGKGNFYVTKTGSLLAKIGNIGGWQLDINSLHFGTWGEDNSALICTGSGTSKSIGGSESINNWVFTAGANFGVTKTGALYANSANIQGAITATSGTIGGASITDGTLIVGNANISDINASKINAGDIAAARIQTNLISAINAKVSDLSALTATIGGFQIDSSSIHTKSVAITSNADNSIALSSADFTRTINSTSRTGLRLAIGDKFGVTGDGKVYASSVDLTGKITATSGTIGGIEIEDGALKVSSINIGNLGGASNYAKQTDVTQAIDNIEVGGRNLIRNSTNFNKWYIQGNGAEGEIWHRSASDNTSNINARPRTWIGTGYLADYYNKTVTVSFEIMSPDWSAINEGSSYTGLKGLVVQLETAKGTPYKIIEGTGRYFFSRLGNSNFKTDSELVDGQWVKVTSIPFKIDDSFWTSDTTKADGYDNFTFSFILRRNGEINFRKLKIELGNKATDWTPAPEDIITGENLIPLSKNLKSFTPENLTHSTVTYTDDSCTITNTYGNVKYGIYYDVDVESGLTHTLSFQASNVSGTTINYGVGNRTPGQTASWNDMTGGYKDVTNGKNVSTFTVPDTVTKVRIYFGVGSLNGTMTISNLKLEVGSRATEWIPAPKDIQQAMKVATNYITQINDTGIKITPYNKSGNDYLQINSDAISMYRANKETLRIEDDSIRIGNVNYQNLLLESNQISIKKGSKESLRIKTDEFSYFFKSGISPFHIKQIGHLETQTGNGTKKQFTSNSSYFISQLLGVTINSTEQKENDDYTYSIQNGVCTVSFISTPANNSTIKFNYDIEYQISQISKVANDTDPYSRKHINLSQDCIDVLHVYVNNVETTAWSFPSFTGESGETITLHDYITLKNDPGQGANIKVTYKIQPEGGFYMTLGTRATGQNSPGPYSIVIGEKNFATGQGAFAAGRNVNVSGEYSFAYGDGGFSDSDAIDVTSNYAGAIGKGLKVSRTGGFACGTYNTYSPSYTWAFQVGNGTDPMNRSDAFGVAENGNVYVTGKLISGIASNYRYMFHIEDKTFSNLSVPANNKMSSTQTKSIEVAGYTPIAVSNYGISGTNAMGCSPFAIAFGSDTSGGSTIVFNLYNAGNSAATVEIRFTILYMATAAL